MAADDNCDDLTPVFSAVELLPHHEDQPFLRNVHHDVHRERHRNTKDYVAETHSPRTNRKNAGILLRRMSDDFNVRKFPEVVEQVKVRQRAMSEGSVQPLAEPEDSAPSKMYKLVRRLSSTAISPSNPSRTLAPRSPLLESTEEDEDNSQDNQ